MVDRDDGHCHDPASGCFPDEGAPIDVCACNCDRCVEAREQLLREQDEGDEEPQGGPERQRRIPNLLNTRQVRQVNARN